MIQYFVSDLQNYHFSYLQTLQTLHYCIVLVSMETVNTKSTDHFFKTLKTLKGSEGRYNYFLCFLLRVVPVVLEDDQSCSKRYKSTQVKLQFLIYELRPVRAICYLMHVHAVLYMYRSPKLQSLLYLLQ